MFWTQNFLKKFTPKAKPQSAWPASSYAFHIILQERRAICGWKWKCLFPTVINPLTWQKMVWSLYLPGLKSPTSQPPLQKKFPCLQWKFPCRLLRSVLHFSDSLSDTPVRVQKMPRRRRFPCLSRSGLHYSGSLSDTPVRVPSS